MPTITIKGIQGEKPIKGIDYLTDEELVDIKKEITPVKGKDFLTQEDIEEMKRSVVPVKGKDYFDGLNAVVDYQKIINDILKKIPKPKNGRSPMFIGEYPPEDPRKGDLWYQP